MKPRVLVVTDDALEWQSLTRELGSHFDLLRANGKDQALALLDREADLVALISYVDPLGRTPDLMQRAATRKPKVTRLLISTGKIDAQATVVSTPAAALAALGAVPAREQHALRIEPRTPVRAKLPVSTSAWQGFIPLVTRDASRGGVYLLYSERSVPTSGSRCAA